MGRGVQSREPALLERHDQLAAIQRAARRAEAGEGSASVVAGAAGMGKSRVLRELAQRLQRRDMRILKARGSLLEREFAFGLVRQLLDPVITQATEAQRKRLFGGAAAFAAPLFGMGEAEADPTGFPILNGLWWLLAAIAAVQPVALLVDDAHWADPASLRWLAFLLPRIGEVPALLVAAGRTDEPGAPGEWATLRVDSDLKVDLEPLSAAGISDLLGRRLGYDPPLELAAAARTATGGNPFLLTELVREVDARGGIGAGGLGDVGELAPESVKRWVLQRLGTQSEEVQQIARASAVLGDDVPIAQVAELSDLGVAEARSAAARLAELGILQHTETISFEHPIVREAVYESIVPVERAQMHRRAAEVMERQGLEVERQAAHLLLTDPAGDESTIDVLTRAANSASERGAMDAAADYLARALTEAESSPRRARLMAELGRAELYAGRPDAEQHLKAAAAMAEDPEVKADAIRELMNVLVAQGNLDEAADLADGLRQLRPEDLSAEISLLATASVAGANVWAEISGRLHDLADAARSAGDAGKPLLALLAFDEIRRGGSSEVAGELAAAALEADTLLERGPEYPPFLMAVYSAIRGQRITLAKDVLDRAITESRARGSLFGFGFCSAYRGAVHGYRSDLDACEADLRGALEAARDNGWTLLEWQALAYYLYLLILRGEIDVAQAELERSGLEGELGNNSVATALIENRAAVRLAQGRWEDSYRDLSGVVQREAAYSKRSQLIWSRADTAKSLAHLGRFDEASAVAVREVEMARAWGDPVNLGRALHALGVARGNEGIADLEAAVATLDGVYDVGLAGCLLDLGSALRRTGRRADSRPLLERALEISERIGAHSYAETARTELAAAGARPRRVVRTGVEALTPSELRVGKLAATGRSNPEIAQELFVTRKTVEKHLGNVFMKLDISSREQLPDHLGADAG